MGQLLRGSSLSLILLFSASATYGNLAPNDLRNHTAINDINSELLISQAEGEVAAEIERLMVKGRYDKSIKSEFSPAILKLFRHTYAKRIFKPVWTPQGVDALMAYSDDMFAHGIASKDIFKNNLSKLYDTRFNHPSAEKRAKADIKLSKAFFRAASAISGGLSDEGGVKTSKISGPLTYILADALTRSGQGAIDTELSALEPVHPQYKSLKKQLSSYRTLLEQGGWLAIRDGDAIELGDRDARVPLLRARLAKEGYHSYVASSQNEENAATDINVMDVGLTEALKGFQKRHGLEADGVVGGNTLEALNESPESKIDRIADTMYRWRIQGNMGKRYIWANIPSYTAEGWNEATREIRMKTIVGKVRFATPEFSDRVEYVVANPKWFVPISITRRQKLPKMRKDPTYAERYNYTVSDRKTGEIIDPLTVDWTEKGVARKYRFVQGPGDGNALGEMKIIFPNQYSIYLHGTPGKHLFDRAERAFSSGCVRLEDPVAMAKWIAKGDDGVSRAEIAKAVEEGEREKFLLDEKLPVHITYFTVTANDDGSLNFWRDIYDRDDGISYVKKYAKPVKRMAKLPAIEKAAVN